MLFGVFSAIRRNDNPSLRRQRVSKSLTSAWAENHHRSPLRLELRKRLNEHSAFPQFSLEWRHFDLQLNFFFLKTAKVHQGQHSCMSSATSLPNRQIAIVVVVVVYYNPFPFFKPCSYPVRIRFVPSVRSFGSIVRFDSYELAKQQSENFSKGYTHRWLRHTPKTFWGWSKILF